LSPWAGGWFAPAVLDPDRVVGSGRPGARGLSGSRGTKSRWFSYRKPGDSGGRGVEACGSDCSQVNEGFCAGVRLSCAQSWRRSAQPPSCLSNRKQKSPHLCEESVPKKTCVPYFRPSL